MDSEYYIYYLVFKLYDQDKKWIISYSNNLRDLKKSVRNVKDDDGAYIIIERKGKEKIFNKKFKQFKVLDFLKSDKILYYT